jgi:hypothetical protein
MRLRDLILDTWAPLSHKSEFSRPGAGGEVRNGPGWLPPQDRRRLLAYQLLKAYQANVARVFIPEAGEVLTSEQAVAGGAGDGDDDRREYGDPQLIVKQTVAALLGESQQISVPDAEGADEEDEALTDPVDGESPEEAAARESENEQITARNADRAQARLALEREEWLQTWADLERLPLKLLESEKNAVGMGDGVYLLAWSGRKGRPTCTVVDPGFYFPVLPEGLSDDYPERVHLAWEIAGDPDRRIPTRLRRVTYELGPIRPAAEPTVTPLGTLRRLVPFLPDGPEPPLLEGDWRDLDPNSPTFGSILRRYPWQAEDEDPATRTCYMTEAEWDLNDLGTTSRDGLYDLDESTARFQTNDEGELLDRLDLGIDFVPVVHVPNTVALADHYGESSLSPVLQLLDELASSDTDESAASATTGNPPIGVSGIQLERGSDGQPVRMAMGPGEVWGLGENGALSTVDTSPALTALAGRVERLLDRLGINTRLPGTVLGRGTDKSPSGYHLQLTFGPLTAMVREGRLARQEKYPLLLKFVQRLAMVGQVKNVPALPAGPVWPADLAFGNYLPTDLQTLINDTAALYKAKLISLETAVRRLRDGGLPIEDVMEEVARIQQRDFQSANELADATNDQPAVRDYLGLEPSPALTVPVLDLPAIPPAAGA